MQPSLIKSAEAITAVLLNHNGILYHDLLSKAMNASSHSSNTVARAAKMLKDEGAVTTLRVGYQVKYFLTERAAHKKREQEEFLPVRRQVVKAAEAPRIGGERLSPFEWTVAKLLMEAA